MDASLDTLQQIIIIIIIMGCQMMTMMMMKEEDEERMQLAAICQNRRMRSDAARQRAGFVWSADFFYPRRLVWGKIAQGKNARGERG